MASCKTNFLYTLSICYKESWLFLINFCPLDKIMNKCNEINSVNFFYDKLLLTQLPERLGSELPNDGFALMRSKFDDSSSLVDGKPKLSLLFALPSANSSENLDRLNLKLRGKDEKTSAFKSVLVSSSESDWIWEKKQKNAVDNPVI